MIEIINKTGFEDPGLNDGLDAVDDSEMVSKALEKMTYSERLIMVTLCGIGARVDRILEKVVNLEKGGL